MTQAALLTDGYKLAHKEGYHPDIDTVYSNFTSRNGRLSNTLSDEGVVFVGLQYFIKDVLIKDWNETFFQLPKANAVGNFKRIVDAYLGVSYDTTHFEELYDLGYLPIQIKALPEGSIVSYGVPPVTFVNTVEGFQWLSNYIETVMSTENWPIQTSATTALAYFNKTKGVFEETGFDVEVAKFMVHDFSFRGCFGRHAAAMSGFGHLASGLVGTDTLPAIMFAEKYYNANVDTELVGCSVPATEHSTATSYIMIESEKQGISKAEAEVQYVKYLFTKFPTGILSHVSDSFDFWDFVGNGLGELKDDIMAREGTFVVRPDSGDPVDVLCGTIHHVDSTHTPEEKGLIECLWDLFGGTITDKGYKLLDHHIGAIYGDSITLARQEEIYKRLMAKGFVPNVVLGVGSYSYQMVTRDTHGSAVKATDVKVKGKHQEVFKDPKTDSKKKSAKGLLRVEKEDGKFVLYDQQTPEQEEQGLLETVFIDGHLIKETSLEEIRQRVAGN